MDVNHYTLLSTLIGTIVGGVITWLVTRYSLNKQFKEQEKRNQWQEIKNEVIALNAVLKEIEHNLIQFQGTKKVMISEEMDFINYKDSGIHNNYSMEKWNNHSDVIFFIEDLDCISKLQSFYINLSIEINNQVTNWERNQKLINSGLYLSKELKKYIALYRKRETT